MVDLSLGLRPGGYRFSWRVSFYISLGTVLSLRMAGATLEDIIGPAGAVLPCFLSGLAAPDNHAMYTNHQL